MVIGGALYGATRMTIEVLRAALRQAMPIPDRNLRRAPVMAIPSIVRRASLMTIIEPAR